MLLVESRPSLVHNTGVSPPQLYSSPSRRSTLPTAPPHQYASSFQGQPDPSPAGSVSHYPPYPARYASIGSSNPPPSMTQRAATMPMPGHPNIAPSMPYDMSLYPPSHSEMSGGPQPSSQTWSHRAYLELISLVSFRVNNYLTVVS